MIYLQQGDVLFHKVEEIGDLGVNLETNVIQEGEATGHAHRLDKGNWQFFENEETKQRHLRVVEPVMLRHEEHKAFEIPAGLYRIGIVREYDHFDEEARQVRD